MLSSFSLLCWILSRNQAILARVDAVICFFVFAKSTQLSHGKPKLVGSNVLHLQLIRSVVCFPLSTYSIIDVPTSEMFRAGPKSILVDSEVVRICI